MPPSLDKDTSIITYAVIKDAIHDHNAKMSTSTAHADEFNGESARKLIIPFVQNYNQMVLHFYYNLKLLTKKTFFSARHKSATFLNNSQSAGSLRKRQSEQNICLATARRSDGAN
uniref:Uncharacterized protein n=1 Tax=Oryza barthii TaxID=65489 RepID=A0A0D3FFJ5_9ORYZ